RTAASASGCTARPRPAGSRAVPCPPDRRGSPTASGRGPWVPSAFLEALDEVEDLGGVSVALLAGAGLQVEPQQRLGVRWPKVEPPVIQVDGETVETILHG